MVLKRTSIYGTECSIFFNRFLISFTTKFLLFRYHPTWQLIQYYNIILKAFDIISNQKDIYLLHYTKNTLHFDVNILYYFYNTKIVKENFMEPIALDEIYDRFNDSTILDHIVGNSFETDTTPLHELKDDDKKMYCTFFSIPFFTCK